MNSMPLILDPSWSKWAHEVISFPPLMFDSETVLQSLATATRPSELGDWEMGLLEAASRVRELFAGDADAAVAASHELQTRRLASAGALRLGHSDPPDVIFDKLRRAREGSALQNAIGLVEVVPWDTLPRDTGVDCNSFLGDAWERLNWALWGVAGDSSLGLMLDAHLFALAAAPAGRTEAVTWLRGFRRLAQAQCQEVGAAHDAGLRIALAIESPFDTPEEVTTRLPGMTCEEIRERVLGLDAFGRAHVRSLARVLTGPLGSRQILFPRDVFEAAYLAGPLHRDDEREILGADPDRSVGCIERCVAFALLFETRSIVWGDYLAVTSLVIARWWQSATSDDVARWRATLEPSEGFAMIPRR